MLFGCERLGGGLAVPGGTTRLLALINTSVGANLNADDFGIPVFFHELIPVVDSSEANESKLDTGAGATLFAGTVGRDRGPRVERCGRTGFRMTRIIAVRCVCWPTK